MKSLSYCLLSIFIFSLFLGCQVEGTTNINKVSEGMSAMPKKPQEIINGKWSIHQIVAYSRIMTIDKSTAEKLIGSSLQISPSSIQSDASVAKSILLPTDADTTPTLANPSYDFTLLDKQKEEDSRSPSLKQLGLAEDEVYRVDIYKDKQLEDQWSLGYSFARFISIGSNDFIHQWRVLRIRSN